jgi:hypothetical protein
MQNKIFDVDSVRSVVIPRIRDFTSENETDSTDLAVNKLADTILSKLTHQPQVPCNRFYVKLSETWSFVTVEVQAPKPLKIAQFKISNPFLTHSISRVVIPAVRLFMDKERIDADIDFIVEQILSKLALAEREPSTEIIIEVDRRKCKVTAAIREDREIASFNIQFIREPQSKELKLYEITFNLSQEIMQGMSGTRRGMSDHEKGDHCISRELLLAALSKKQVQIRKVLKQKAELPEGGWYFNTERGILHLILKCDHSRTANSDPSQSLLTVLTAYIVSTPTLKGRVFNDVRVSDTKYNAWVAGLPCVTLKRP